MSTIQEPGLLTTPMRRIMMIIGTLLFILMAVYMAAAAGSPKAAHASGDVQPEIHSNALLSTKVR